MPSSITLTVSHLPTSTSFFLSALQPLGYAYRGRSDNTIGFGPQSSDTPIDFWITQEIPGVPAGAAHVAFPASSHEAVERFFVAALKAGGKIHGEPCIRDQHGYYSAAVIDFDGNSIEAVYKPGYGSDNKENVNSMALQKLSTKAPSTIVRSNTTRAPSQGKSTASKAKSVATSRSPTSAPRRSKSNGDVLDVILNEAQGAVKVAKNLIDRVSSKGDSTARNPNEQRKDSSDAIVGTLIGVAAGAALHYAFSNRNKDSDSDEADHQFRRPSLSGRSTSDPVHSRYSVHHEPSRHVALEAPHSTYSNSHTPSRRFITMQDNDRNSDYASTIRPNRRNSIDSGFASTSSRPSIVSKRGSGERVKTIEPPPSSYRGPTSAIQPNDKPRSRSRASSTSRRSTSHTRSSSKPPPNDAQTIYHITEQVKRTTRPTSSFNPDPFHRQHSPSHPPSRAATWAAPGSDTSKTTKTNTYISAKTTFPDPRHSKQSATASVVGKARETRRLDLPDRELRPDDSVSQVSSTHGSRRGRKR